MKAVEEPAKQFVAETTRLIKAAARPLIVAEVYECPALSIESVGPVRIVE
jgi:hypothetical protein